MAAAEVTAAEVKEKVEQQPELSKEKCTTDPNFAKLFNESTHYCKIWISGTLLLGLFWLLFNLFFHFSGSHFSGSHGEFSKIWYFSVVHSDCFCRFAVQTPKAELFDFRYVQPENFLKSSASILLFLWIIYGNCN